MVKFFCLVSKFGFVPMARMSFSSSAALVYVSVTSSFGLLVLALGGLKVTAKEWLEDVHDECARLESSLACTIDADAAWTPLPSIPTLAPFES